ncbi:hypothetical protein L6452_20846 [Arctium lappa]|uniref:Uncharacterized protein n=1 Tax=Arctium lappa TaxID=4217 RepID=A0ACB9BDB7_ARCLA|nr:hypothetical protein L6452_20846 [Arctium lappa]
MEVVMVAAGGEGGIQARMHLDSGSVCTVVDSGAKWCRRSIERESKAEKHVENVLLFSFSIEIADEDLRLSFSIELADEDLCLSLSVELADKDLRLALLVELANKDCRLSFSAKLA